MGKNGESYRLAIKEILIIKTVVSQFYEVDYHDMDSISDTSADENWIDKNVILCSEGGCDT